MNKGSANLCNIYTYQASEYILYTTKKQSRLNHGKTVGIPLALNMIMLQNMDHTSNDKKTGSLADSPWIQ